MGRRAMKTSRRVILLRVLTSSAFMVRCVLLLMLLVHHTCTAGSHVSTTRHVLPLGATRTRTTIQQSVTVPKNSVEKTTISQPKNEYAEYLKLDQLLPALQPRTDAHDETLFIVQHQTFELWLKLLLHELDAVRDALQKHNNGDAMTDTHTLLVSTVFPKLDRATIIIEHLDHAWSVLQTMHADGFGEFRHALGSASGIQSVQFRQVLFLLGQREQRQPHQQLPTCLEEELLRPSLYDEVLIHLFRVGVHPGDWSQHYTPNHPAAVAAWRTVYNDPVQHILLYMLAEKLLAFDKMFSRWRFNHLYTVKSMIADKKGTGGTEGVRYLRKVIDVKLFPEISRDKL